MTSLFNILKSKIFYNNESRFETNRHVKAAKKKDIKYLLQQTHQNNSKRT